MIPHVLRQLIIVQKIYFRLSYVYVSCIHASELTHKLTSQEWQIQQEGKGLGFRFLMRQYERL